MITTRCWQQQSGYRRYHSTEITLVKVHNDLLMATDNGQISAVCLFDLTAAFDTVNHELRLQRLECSFDIKGLALTWFRSYPTGRTFFLVYTGITSTTISVACSFPQGSVLGPLLFILNTADLSELGAKHRALKMPSPMTYSYTITATATVSLLPRAHWSCVSWRWAIGCQTIILHWMRIGQNSWLAPTTAPESCREMVPHWLWKPTSSTLPPAHAVSQCRLHLIFIWPRTHPSLVLNVFFQLRQLWVCRSLDAN